MRKRRKMSLPIFTFIVGFSLLNVQTGSAVDADGRCAAAKLKAADKLFRCLVKAGIKDVKGGFAVDREFLLDICGPKDTKKLDRLETTVCKNSSATPALCPLWQAMFHQRTGETLDCDEPKQGTTLLKNKAVDCTVDGDRFVEPILCKLTRELISALPVERPANWIDWVNEPELSDKLKPFRTSAHRGTPFGTPPGYCRPSTSCSCNRHLASGGRPRKGS